ncbi:MAG: hypothetical protein JWQ74_1525 [Marmoricola sp.]|nr:hypothetical protein [Marmoricola sp.]
MADRANRTARLTYDPVADVAERYPEWFVGTAPLGGVIPEVLCLDRRVILVEQDQDPAAQRCSLAHAVAHLDLGHGRAVAGFFENREEADADCHAARLLISLEAFAEALSWTRSRIEVADELVVDLAILAVRERILTRAERTRLRRWIGPLALAC